MHRLLALVRSRAHLLAGMGGLLGIGAVGLAPEYDSTPDAGVLDPLEVASAEKTEVLTLESGRFLGPLLRESDLPEPIQNEVVAAIERHANPSRLPENTEVRIRYVRDTRRVLGIEVQHSDDALVRIDPRPWGWQSALVVTPVRTDTIAVGGLIDTSLWTSVMRNAELADVPESGREQIIGLLDRVFRWSVDFSRQSQPGDTYRVVLEREVRPNGSMRSVRILAAELVNADRPLHAIWFDVHGDGDGGYYDLDGESTRAAFIRAPVEFLRISSRFSRNRFHPILRVPRPHVGVDYAAATGTPVMATADGVVTYSGRNGGYGIFVEIRHDEEYTTRYAHLSVATVRVGSRVAQGQTIGEVGMTGLATGPHLHYELHRRGSPIDPLTLADIPTGDPIPPLERDRWVAELGGRLAILRTIPSTAVLRVAQAQTPKPEAAPAIRR